MFYVFFPLTIFYIFTRSKILMRLFLNNLLQTSLFLPFCGNTDSIIHENDFLVKGGEHALPSSLQYRS